MIKVSVIVPVYNVYDYLDKCLNSLVNQSLKEIEIIIVNDGSTDNSQDIIDKYSKKYQNIKSFIKKNGGLSDTRNFGIERAVGEYITFVDSDDYIDKDMYLEMYEKAKSKDFDIVTSDINYVYKDRKVSIKTDPKTDTDNILELFINFYPTVCTKIFKKELFTNYNLKFKKGVWYEDVELMYRMIPHIKKIGVIHKAYYQYIQRNESITSTVSSKIYDYINNFNGLVDYYKENNLFSVYQKELEYAYVRYIYATFIKTALGYNYSDYLKAVDCAIKNVYEHFPKYRRNKYFYKSLKGLYLIMFNKTMAKILYKKRGNL